MHTLLESMTRFPRAVQAANDDLVRVVTAASEIIERRSPGWDPYEVWRTRIKAVQEHRKPPSAPPLR